MSHEVFQRHDDSINNGDLGRRHGKMAFSHLLPVADVPVPRGLKRLPRSLQNFIRPGWQSPCRVPQIQEMERETNGHRRAHAALHSL